ncbi:MAG: DUF2169 domain-containing protein [Legionellales bacterium]|nr:DUF2169 domain-containing protein [Legionellales bacterium]
MYEHHLFLGEKNNSSLQHAADNVPFKQGAEILVQGMAYPNGNEYCDVSLIVNRAKLTKPLVEKSLRVFGEREWRRSPIHFYISKKPLSEPLALHYEYAYGGKDPANPYNIYPYNPCGLGFTEDYFKINRLALPRIEKLSRLIEKISDQVAPGGFGPMPVEWLAPNHAHAKIYDRPEYFYNAAPRDQRIESAWLGNESICLAGFFPDQPALTLTLPDLKLRLITPQQGTITPLCDTILIDTEKHSLEMIWRFAYCENINRLSGEIVIQCE